MRSSKKPVFIVLLLFCISASKCIAQANENTTTNKAELEALYWAQKKEARSEYTEADVNFMVGMIGHHAQAIIMSRLAPKNGASEQVLTLSKRIINAQKAEIKTMQHWLEVRGEPVPMVHIDGLKLMIMGGDGSHMDHMNHMNMPGMLSPEQLDSLAAARNGEFDHLFLTYMIQHHKGAVYMAQKLFKTEGAARGTSTFRIATNINVDQITEIQRMQRMLADLAQ